MDIDSLLSVLQSSSGDSLSVAAAWLAMAFVLGLVHAFDADHVMALSVFATRKEGGREGLRAGLRWATGHGLVLFSVGLILLLLGRSLPSEIANAAERLVGLAMIVLGLMVWIDLARRRSHLHFHAHDDLLPHAHWHMHDDDGRDRGVGHRAGHDHDDGHGHDHGALMVGALHGLAGSAPILAVLPAAARSPLLGLAYLVIFALGVALAMAIVSGLIGKFAARLSRRAQSGGISLLRGCCASGSIVLGAWLAVAG